MELSNHAASRGISPFAAVISMFYEPAKTFAALEQRRGTWLPLLLLMASTAILMLWYFSSVDIDWLKEQMFATVKDPGQRAKSMEVVSRNMLMFGGIGQAVIGLPIFLALIGLYFMFVGKIYAKDFSFGKGFSLATWTSVPALLTLVLGGTAILLSKGGQVALGDLNPLSLNALLFHRPIGDPLNSLFESISLLTVWSAVLMVIGFQAWARVPRATAIKVVVIPYLVIYGVWLAIALLRAA